MPTEFFFESDPARGFKDCDVSGIQLIFEADRSFRFDEYGEGLAGMGEKVAIHLIVDGQPAVII